MNCWDVDLQEPEPQIMRVRAGILAKAPDDFRYRFAVIGETEEAARQRFSASFVEWSAVHELIRARRRLGLGP